MSQRRQRMPPCFTGACTCAATPGRLCAVCVQRGNLGWPVGLSDGASPSTLAPEVQTPALPVVDPVQPSPAALQAEGAEFAEALLLNIRTGKAAPKAIADLVQFLAAGEMLAGACMVLHRAIREGAGRA